jgi:ubiquinone/menaquinone biosynthesis C-methylase UbiE
MIDTETMENLKRKFYPGADTVVFEPVAKALERYIQPGARVLDAGCGEGTWVLRDFRDKIDYLVGIDILPPKEKVANEFVLCNLENIPLADNSFDVIVCYFVIEHLVEPEKAFAEFARLLSDGGVIIFRTPNIATPLFLISRLTPLRWHERMKRAFLGNRQVDTFHTYYRCNTFGKIERTLKITGFQREKLESVEQIYSYFTFSKIVYGIGLLVSRFTQLCPFTRPFRSQIIGVYRKLPVNNKTLASIDNKSYQASAAELN